jgi:hypothetical protein
MTALNLTQRAVACKGWRWMGGMLTVCGVRLYEGGTDYVIGYRCGPTRDGGGPIDEDGALMVPDLDDPATLGCIEHGLLPEVYGSPISLVFDGEKWGCSDVEGSRVAKLDGRSFWSDRHPRSTRFDSEAAALEAAP